MRSAEIRKMIKEGHFNARRKLSRSMMEKLVKRARPTAKFSRKTAKGQICSNLLLVQFQTAVNEQLQHTGKHLRSHDYYTEFHVMPKAKTKPVVESYYNRASASLACGMRLSKGRAK